MRVGFVTQLLWPRYGDFWKALVTGAGLEVVYPVAEAVRGRLGDAQLGAVPGLAFRLAAAQALALEADVLLAPQLNPRGGSTRGGGQDPFIADFPEALVTHLYGLPPVIGVPASLEGPLETLAVSTLLKLTHDPALVRRTWERNRSRARAPRLPEPKWRVRPSEGEMVGVLGQPWLLSDALAQRAAAHALAPEVPGRLDRPGHVHLVSQHQLSPALLREEGRRVDEGLVDTDLEVLGAARFLGRKGGVGRLVMLADETSGADAWLVAKVQRLVYKPLTVISLQALGQDVPLHLLATPDAGGR
jgi:hypothetical protein